jgi:hypothetical protein
MAALLGLNTVQQVRHFLAQNGVPQKPWTGASEVLGALEGLLAARAEDPAFWVPLKALLEQLQAHARSMDCPYLPCPEAEILKAARLDEVIADLKAALPGRAEDQPHVALTRLAAPSLCCVLLLAMAAGCESSGGGVSGKDVAGNGEVAGQEAEEALAAPEPDGGEIQGAVETAEEAGEVAGPAEVEQLQDPGPEPQEEKTLQEYIDDSDLDPYTKYNLQQCLENAYSSQEREALVTLFQTETAAEISAKLQEIADSERCGPYMGGGELYKGVTFPARTRRRA